MNSQFDKSAFSILLKRALGNRTQKSFAEDIQMSKEHLSRLVTQKRETPPTIDTLTKIALNSQNRVSLQELLSVCGYDPNTVSVPATINHMMETVKLALSHIPYHQLLPNDFMFRKRSHSPLVFSFSFRQYFWNCRP